MEVLIAILWYLQVFFIGTSYTTDEVDMMIYENQTTIETIQTDQQLTEQIVDDYMDETMGDPMGNIIEPWEEEPPQPELD